MRLHGPHSPAGPFGTGFLPLTLEFKRTDSHPLLGTRPTTPTAGWGSRSRSRAQLTGAPLGGPLWAPGYGGRVQTTRPQDKAGKEKTKQLVFGHELFSSLLKEQDSRF